MDVGSLLSGAGAALVGIATLWGAFGERGKKRRQRTRVAATDPIGAVVRDLAGRLQDDYDEMEVQRDLLVLWTVALVRACQEADLVFPAPPEGLKLPGLAA